MQMKFTQDVPVGLVEGSEDQLGYTPFIATLAEAVRGADTPFVFGVLGDWGTGKTSILRLLERTFKADLHKQDQQVLCVPIWFDAWKYENEASVIYPLLNTIRTSYRAVVTHNRGLDRFGEAFRRVLAASFQVVSQLGIKRLLKAALGDEVKLDDLKNALYDAKKREEASSIMEKALSEWADEVGTLHKAFTALIQQYAADLTDQIGVSRPIKFVILIDDLDRCLPETTISILEGIKNHLSVEGCVFVMALNARVVYQAIRRKYPGAEVDGREYLEKILNFSFYVPEPDKANLQRWVDSQLRARLTDADFERVKHRLGNFSSTLQSCNFSNPRKIWRACNRYLVFLAMYGPQMQGKYQGHEVTYHPDTVVQLIMLAEYFPTIFQLMLRSPQELRKEMLEMLNGTTPVETFEAKYGVQLSLILPQLRQNKDLLALKANPEQIPAHVQAVYECMRLL